MIEELCAQLREKRRSLGLTVEEVVEKTKLHPSAVHDIEDGMLTNISPTYLKGFLRIYAAFLGVEIGGALEEISPTHPSIKRLVNHREQVAAEQLAQKPQTPQRPTPAPRVKKTSVLLKIAGAIGKIKIPVKTVKTIAVICIAAFAVWAAVKGIKAIIAKIPAKSAVSQESAEPQKTAASAKAKSTKPTAKPSAKTVNKSSMGKETVAAAGKPVTKGLSSSVAKSIDKVGKKPATIAVKPIVQPLAPVVPAKPVVAPAVTPTISAVKPAAATGTAPETAPVSASPSQTVAAPPLPVSAPAVETKEINVSLTVRKNCFLRVRVDGKVIYEGILKEGNVEGWKAKKEVELKISDGSAVYLEVNGKPLPKLTAMHKPIKSLKITAAGISVDK